MGDGCRKTRHGTWSPVRKENSSTPQTDGSLSWSNFRKSMVNCGLSTAARTRGLGSQLRSRALPITSKARKLLRAVTLPGAGLRSVSVEAAGVRGRVDHWPGLGCESVPPEGCGTNPASRGHGPRHRQQHDTVCSQHIHRRFGGGQDSPPSPRSRGGGALGASATATTASTCVVGRWGNPLNTPEDNH